MDPAKDKVKSKVQIMTLTLNPINEDIIYVHFLTIETILANLKETSGNCANMKSNVKIVDLQL